VTAFERPRGSGRWAAKFEHRGEQVWVPGSPFSSRSAAVEAERRHRDRLNETWAPETCASFADRWLEEWPRPEASTRTLYAQAARRFADHFGPTMLNEVERISARSWALGVPRNISKIIGTMYEDARNVGLVESNPFSNLRLPKTERTAEVAPPTLEEFRRLLNACIVLGGYAAEFRALIQFTAWTGLRAGEVQGLQWDDVAGDELHVRRARKSDDTYGLPKNGQERRIALPTPAQVLDAVPRRDGSPFVFHTPKGKPLKKGNLYYHWKAVREASGTSVDRAHAGVPLIRFHDLRHFCATQLLELGLDHFAVSIQLGHTDGGALVMARYGHPSRDAARERLLAVFDAESASATTPGRSQVAGAPHRSAG
jgi:integrase